MRVGGGPPRTRGRPREPLYPVRRRAVDRRPTATRSCRLGDRFGPRTIYLIGLALFTASSLACGLASSSTALITARAFQGLGGAMVTPQTMSVMIRTFSPKERGGAMGVWGATAGLATVTGPLLGGVLVDASTPAYSQGWESFS